MGIDSSSETYFELTCKLPSDFAELWSCFCFEQGALGIEILEESKSESVHKIFFEKMPTGGVKKLVGVFQNEIPIELNFKILQENILPVENWQENWHKHFLPVKISKSLIILPSWENEKEFFGRHPIWIKPGQVFGTGHHISTILALEILEKFLSSINKIPETMIDIGIGTGILSLGACRLGVKKVKGVDIDEKTLEEVKKNIELNFLEGKIETFIGEPYILDEPAPIVICNMLFSELLRIKNEFVRLTCPKGSLICSGFLKNQEIFLKDEMRDLGFKFCSVLTRDNWSSIRFEKI